MRWGNIIIGALGLAVLQGIVSGKGAGNLGGFVAKAGTAVRWFVDPTVPAFKSTSTPSTSSAANSLASQPVATGASAVAAGGPYQNGVSPTFSSAVPTIASSQGASA